MRQRGNRDGERAPGSQRIRVAGAVGVLVMVVGGLVPLGASPAGASSAGRADTALDAALKRLIAMPGGPPGAVAVVQRGTQRQVFTAGVADQRTGARIGANDRWRLGSVSKAFSGAVALQLVAEGKLSLTDTIASRLPQLPAAWGAVTLAELLQHTGGVPDYTKDPAFVAALQRDPNQPVAPMTLIGYVANEPLEFAPGSEYRYSDTDNIIVALMAEAVTGLSYETLLNQLVFDPLDLRETSMALGYRMPAPYVHGYDNGLGRQREDVSDPFNLTYAWASGAMVATPTDLNTFIRAYVGGKLISGPTRQAQLSFVPGSSGPPGPGTNAAGLAVFRYRTSCGTVYGHTGNIPGYTTFAASSANGQRSVVVQVSTQLSPGLKAPGVARAFPALRRAEGLGVCAAMAH